MRIGYISYEHPMGVTGGGIGTYLGQIAKLMNDLGHEVVVFTGHPEHSETITYDGYTVHRVQAKNGHEFRKNVVEKFRTQHALQAFDVMESGEYGADALEVKKAFCDLPLTVKLHTPTFLVSRLNGQPFGAFKKILFLLKCLRRGIVQKPYWIYDKAKDPEFEIYQLADTVSSPSNSLKQIIQQEWGQQKKIAVVPLPFAPAQELLNIPLLKKGTDKIIICFIGRLEIRKGILVLLKSIPKVIRQNRNIVFRFVGEALASPKPGMDMREYFYQELGDYAAHLEFTGKQPPEKIPELIKDCIVCVFPSLWENFPNVCLEAMAAGKVVIGTNNGGMADIIAHNVSGLLVNPRSPAEIAKAILDITSGALDIEQVSVAARNRILTAYSYQKIGQMTEALYLETINCKEMSRLEVDV